MWRGLVLVLLASTVSAQTTTTRASTTTIVTTSTRPPTTTSTTLEERERPPEPADHDPMATLFESARTRGDFGPYLLPTADATWMRDRFLTDFDATAMVTVGGVVRGYWPSIDWDDPSRAAVVALVWFPILDPALTSTERPRVVKRLLRRVVTDLQATAVPPTALSCTIPRTASDVVTILTGLGAVVVSSATEDGVPVLDKVEGNLAALDAALTAEGY